MHRPALTDVEQTLLRDYFRTSPIQLIRLKAQALLMVDEGLPQVQVGRFVVRKERTVQRWVRDFASRRLASLFSGHVDNENASKLTRKQKREIRDVLRKPPSDADLPKAFWDVPQLKQYVQATFGVVYESTQSYHFLLKFSDLSFKYPDRANPRRDEAQIVQRVAAIRREIAPLLVDEHWVVFTSDETRIQLEAEIRRAWLKKGERTVVKTERSKEHQNYLGFLDQRYGDCQVFEIERGNQAETIRVLKRLVKRYPNQRICIIWDNARWHKGKELRRQLGAGHALERIHLINLAPYAPETNPIEHVWNDAKHQLANRQEETFATTKRTFLSVLESRKFHYAL